MLARRALKNKVMLWADRKKEKPNHGGLYEVKATIGKGIDGKLIRKSFILRLANETLSKRLMNISRGNVPLK